MNSSSRWRIALAERISQPYRQHPQAKAVMVVGSVAYGWADRYSDIDLSVVWDTLPDASERVALIERIGGVPEGSGDAFYVCGDMSKGVRVDVGHTTQAEVEQVLINLRQRPAEIRTKQALLGGLQQAIPLHWAALIAQWRTGAALYSDALAEIVVQGNLKFGPSWALHQLVEQNDLLALRDSLCAATYHLLRLLMGMNRVYDLSVKSLPRHLASIEIAPPNLWQRLNHALQGDPLTGATTLSALIAETLDLVNENMPNVDMAEAQAIFAQPKAKALLPAEYSRPTVQENLDFGPRQNWYVLAEREDWLFLTTWLCAEFHALLNVLAGLNQVEAPMYRWTAWRPSVIQFENFCTNLAIAPVNFKARCLEILQKLTPSSLPLLNALIEETFELVAEHCPDLDTTIAHRRYLEERQPWEQMPLDC